MFEKIVELVFKIPVMLEFIFGCMLYLLISAVTSDVLAGVAEETVCESSGFGSWLWCFYSTNPLMAFISTVGTVVGLGLLFRAKFIK